MFQVSRFLAVGVVLAVSACAIPTKQTDALLASFVAKQSPQARPFAVHIENVPFTPQGENQCGPAALSMAMDNAGNSVPASELTKQIFTPGKKGSFQSDLITAARRNAMMAVEIAGLPALLDELAAGNPVITFENLGLSWYPKWHYAVAVGYDLTEPEITLHSGFEREMRKDLRKFERSWMDSNYWALVVLKPGKLSASGTELAHTVAAAGLEQAGHAREAEVAYRSILEKWPRSFGALIGMGNVRDASGDPKGAAGYLERAVKAHPMSAVAWHNLAIAQGTAGQVASARQSARTAVRLAEEGDPEEAKVYRESLWQWTQ